MKKFNQPSGSIAREVNKQGVAQLLGISQSQVGYIFVNDDITGLSVLIHEASQTYWKNPGLSGVITNISFSSNKLKITVGGTVYQLEQKSFLSIATAKDIQNITIPYSVIKVNGFYYDGDGGRATWMATGTIDTSQAGSHVPKMGLIYSASGVEYQLTIRSNEVNLVTNGAKVVAGKTAFTDDSFVCIGEVYEGVASIFGYVYDNGGYSSTTSGNKQDKIVVRLSGGLYRIGRYDINNRAGMSFDAGGSIIQVTAATGYDYASTGVRLNGFSMKRNAAYWRANTTSWDLASWNQGFLKNVTFIGDHVPSKTRDACTAGVGVELINPQHCTLENVAVHNFLMDCVAREWNAYIPVEWGKVNSNMTYINTMDDSSNTQQGHFYGVTYLNCEFLGSRDGTFINLCDWSTWIGGNLFNQYNWLGGVDATAPLYLVWQMGSHWNLQGGQVGVYHDDTPSTGANYPYTYAPANATVYDICKQSKWGNAYSEWNKTFLEVGALGHIGKSTVDSTGFLSNVQRYTGLMIEMDTAYKPNRKSALVKFSKEMFGAFSGSDDNNWTWTDGVPFSRGDVSRALSQFAVGSPTRDEGAFHHGGYDFRYGTYNTGFYNGVLPDVDSLRGTRKKEFLNDLGLMQNSGSLMFPLVAPAYDSNIVIWYKDLTGNFDLSNIVMNEQSYIDGATMTNTYISTGNLLFDYGNGWKAAVVRNLRPFGYSEERGWSPQNYLRITTTSATPIILKAIQAFQGGVPIYPSSLRPYVPSSQNNGIWGTQSSATACDLYPNHQGGGMFQIGDTVEGWSYLKHNGRWTFTQNIGGNFGYPMTRRTFSTVGAMGSYLTAATFTASVVSVGSSSTTIEIAAASVNCVALGMPIYIASSTGTVTAGQYNLVDRVLNADGTLTNRYIVSGAIGAAGDTLTIDNSKLSYDVQPTRIPYLQTTGWGNIGGTMSVGQWLTVGSTLAVTGATTLNANLSLKVGGITSGTWRAAATATTDLGTSAYTWNNIFSQNAVTVVSDKNYKVEITSFKVKNDASGDTTITEKLLTEILAIEYKSWKLKAAVLKKGEEARLHVGVLAQDILQAFDNAGLDWTRYGVLTKESHTQEVTTGSADGKYLPVLETNEEGEVVGSSSISTDENGEILFDDSHDTVDTTDGKTSITRTVYMVRMEEFLVLRMAAIEQKMGL